MNAPQQQEVVPAVHDVLCGSGDLVRAHKGNHLFHLMLRKHFSLYERAVTKHQKMGVTRLVFDEICLTGARFLRKDPIFQDRWYLATDKQGKDKISHCLRKMKREPRRHRVVEAPWYNKNTSPTFSPAPTALRSSDATGTMASRARLSQPLNMATQGIDRYFEESILKQQMVGHQRDLCAQVAWKDRPTTLFPANEGIQSSSCNKEAPSLGFPSLLATNHWSTLGVPPPGIDWGFHEEQQGDRLLTNTLGESNISTMQALSASSNSAVLIWEDLAATFDAATTCLTPAPIDSHGGASVISL